MHACIEHLKKWLWLILCNAFSIYKNQIIIYKSKVGRHIFQKKKSLAGFIESRVLQTKPYETYFCMVINSRDQGLQYYYNHSKTEQY